jgi:hypothetical protein
MFKTLEGIMKTSLYRIILATVVAIPLGTFASERLLAQTCAPFPAGVVPFLMVHYISATNLEGDRLVVGEMGSTSRGLAIIEQILPPSFANQKFCGSVEMAPGLFVEAYVPTQQELHGDFSAFGDSLFDPLSRQPFPANKIPPDRLYGLLAWRIPSSSAFSATLSIPIVLSLAGAKNSFYTSELTLVNRGTADLVLEFSYTAAYGEGSGIVTDTLPAGRQRILPDAIAYLMSLGLSIPTSADSGGTLTVKAVGLVSPSDVTVTVRTTAALAEGRAGSAYSGNEMWKTFTGVPFFGFDSPYICGLRQNATDRSNVAVMHAGDLDDGEVVLRLTVVSGDPPFAPRTLPDITLTPGGFHQINEVLVSNGLSLSNGYVRVERVSGTAPYYAYGVINDQVNSDGSFVPPTLPIAPSCCFYGRLTVPVIVETGAFKSELVLTNLSASQKRLDLSFVAEGIQAQSHSANFSVELSAGQQLILPNLVQYLRDRGVSGIGPQGADYVGPLFATIDGEDSSVLSGIFIGARTSTASKGGGQFGVFCPVEPDRIATTSAWLYGLQQDLETRTNLALVNTGMGDGNPNTFSIELFDGSTGKKVNTIEGITVDSQGWVQIERILDQFAAGTTSGYAHVTRTAGTNPFIAYAVVNDGAEPGQRTGDGTFVSMQPDVSYTGRPQDSGAGYWDY